MERVVLKRCLYITYKSGMGQFLNTPDHLSDKEITKYADKLKRLNPDIRTIKLQKIEIQAGEKKHE